MTHFPSRQELAAEIGAVHAQADGVIIVEIVRMSDLADLAAAAILGDPHARRIARILGQAGRRIESAPKRAPALCGTCPRPIRPGGKFAFAIATPSCDDPTKALALAICARCATEPDDLLACARRALAKIWPELRPIEIHPDSGNA